MKKILIITMCFMLICVLVFSGCTDTEKDAVHLPQHEGEDYYGCYNYTGETRTCPTCDGTGTVTELEGWGGALWEEEVDCSDCNGDGEQNEIIYVYIFENSVAYNVGETRWIED